jgi:hypothetical protein
VRQYVVMDSVFKNSDYINIKDLKKTIEEDESIKKAVSDHLPKEQINSQLVPKVIKTMYPDLSDDEANSFSKLAIHPKADQEGGPDQRFIRMANKFVNIDDLHIDLIDQVNPFQKAYEILSKSVTPKVLKTIQEVIETTRIQVTEEEAYIMWPKIKAFAATFNRQPDIASTDALERRMAEVLIYLKEQKRKRNHGN